MLASGDPGRRGGDPPTYTGTGDQPTLAQYEAIFGPAGRDIKIDSQRHKRHQRWHLPDALKGPNSYLTDRIDGLITDATSSPFTRNILPYKYLENPDQKLKWNVYSFDEGIASRVPYEAAARVLPQSKQSFSGYVVRQGLAIAMEHNFMVSAAGRENFKHQLTQLVGSIQMTNDLDVHVALLQAPSYQRQIEEKYYDQTRTTSQACRQYTDLFGIMQKHPNALDILIEDAKNHLKTWGSQPPTFLLCNGKLTTQLTMNPERTNYLTNGPDGLARLAQGPDLPSYRGLSIIHSRKFSLDTGTAPRDLMRRKVRVAEYYHIPYTPGVENKHFEFYDQSRDTWFRLSWWQLVRMSRIDPPDGFDDEDNTWHGLYRNPGTQEVNDRFNEHAHHQGNPLRHFLGVGAPMAPVAGFFGNNTTGAVSFANVDLVDHTTNSNPQADGFVGDNDLQPQFNGQNTRIKLTILANLIACVSWAEIPLSIVQVAQNTYGLDANRRTFFACAVQYACAKILNDVAQTLQTECNNTGVFQQQLFQNIRQLYESTIVSAGFTPENESTSSERTHDAIQAVQGIGLLNAFRQAVPNESRALYACAWATHHWFESGGIRFSPENYHEANVQRVMSNYSAATFPELWRAFQQTNHVLGGVGRGVPAGGEDAGRAREGDAARGDGGGGGGGGDDNAGGGVQFHRHDLYYHHVGPGNNPLGGGAPGGRPDLPAQIDLFILRPNIEHEMLSVIMGRGGTQELGCTFWGQTELSCYDDAQHGIWGMSYKYHERAMVTNERNLIRVYDVAFDGYNGGLDQTHVNFQDPNKVNKFKNDTYDRNRPYNGASMLVMRLPHDPEKSRNTLPNPLVFWPTTTVQTGNPDACQAVSDLESHNIFGFRPNGQHEQGDSDNISAAQKQAYAHYRGVLGMDQWQNASDELKTPGERAITGESCSQLLAFEGTMKVYSGGHMLEQHKQGSGHLGPSYPGVASIREGRGVLNPAAAPTLGRLI